MEKKTKNAAIYFNKETKEFHIQGKDFSYIFHILKNNQLGHLYFGRKLKHRESFSRLFRIEPKPNMPVQYEDDHAFSLDIIKQEYPAYGTTDFREPAIHVSQENGSRITNFEYRSHTIYYGKPKLEGLPATYIENDDEAITLEIILYDEVINVELKMLYTVFDAFNALARSVKVTNRGNGSIRLCRIMSANVDFFDSDFEMIQLSGAWARERHVKKRKLQTGIQSISSTRGNASSPHNNPFIALKRPNTDEHHGEVYGFSLIYSGNFLAQVEVDYYDVARVSIGINPFDFSWLLQSGESFQAPEAVIVYSENGLNGMSQTYHELYRNRLVKGRWRDRPRPILINNWEATYFDFNEEKILDLARTAKDLGIELFVLDDGWFGERNDDTSSLGDWYVNRKKLPHGIKWLAEKINKLGLEFGIWIEPEMISKRSELYKKHPDWLIQVPNRRLSPGRNQYVLDFSRDEVVDYIYQMISKILREAPISYVKWDANRYMTEIGSLGLPAERQQEVSHRYILGVYKLYEKLTSEFPHILFESCSAGGARFDPAMLYYAPQTWTSDDTDAIERLKIQYGTSIVYPLSSIGAHVSAVPNHQVGRMTSLQTRANVAFFGVFGYEMDLTKATDKEKKIIKEQVDFYKKYRELIMQGSFYRLISPFEEEQNETAWMVVSKDLNRALVGYYQVLAKPNDGFKRLILKGLCPDKKYKILGQPEIYYGDELMNFGVILNGIIPDKGDFISTILEIESVD